MAKKHGIREEEEEEIVVSQPETPKAEPQTTAAPKQSTSQLSQSEQQRAIENRNYAKSVGAANSQVSTRIVTKRQNIPTYANATETQRHSWDETEMAGREGREQGMFEKRDFGTQNVTVDFSTIKDNKTASYFASTLHDEDTREQFLKDWAKYSGQNSEDVLFAAESEVGDRLFAEPKSKAGQRIKANNTIMDGLNGFGLIGFDGSELNVNTASATDIIRAIRANPNKKERQEAYSLLEKAAKTEGNRFYGLSLDGDDSFLSTAALTQDQYDEFLTNTENAFDPTPGHEAQNEQRYQELMGLVDELDATDYQKNHFRKAVESAYEEQTGAKYDPTASHASAPQADAQSTQEEGGQEEETGEGKNPIVRAAGAVAGFIKGVGEGLSANPQEETHDSAQDSAKVPGSVVRQMRADNAAQNAQTEPGEQQTPAQTPKTAGSAVLAMREGNAQEIANMQGPALPEPSEQAEPEQKIDLAQDPTQAVVEYVLAGRSSELTDETVSAVNSLIDSDPAIGALFGVLTDENTREMYDARGNELNNRVASDILNSNYSVLGGTMSSYALRIQDTDFPAQLRADAAGAMINIIKGARTWAENADVGVYDPELNLYDQYLAANPGMKTAIEAAFSYEDEIKAERREAERLAAEADEKARQEWIDQSREACKTGNATPEQWQTVLDEAPTLSKNDMLADPAYYERWQNVMQDSANSYGAGADNWYNEKALSYMQEHGMGSDLSTIGAAGVKDMLRDWVVDALDQDISVAKALGYDDLQAYYDATGTGDVQLLYQKGAANMQAYEKSLTDDLIEQAQGASQPSYQGTDNSPSSWGKAIGLGVQHGLVSNHAQILEAIYNFTATADIDADSARVSAKYNRDYGFAAGRAVYADTMRELANGGYFPSEEMAQYIVSYLDSGKDPYKLGIMPEDMGWAAQGATERKARAGYIAKMAQQELTPNQGIAFGMTSTTAANVENQLAARILGMTGMNSLITSMAAYGAATFNERTNEALTEGYTLKQAGLLGMTDAFAVAVANAGTEAAMADKLKKLTGLSAGEQLGAQALGTAGGLKAYAGMIKAFGLGTAKNLADETIKDETLEGLFKNGFGGTAEYLIRTTDGESRMPTPAEMAKAALAGLQNLDVQGTLSEVIGDLPMNALYMLPMSLVSGAVDGAQEWKSYKAVKRLAQTGSAKDAADAVQTVISDLDDPEKAKAYNEGMKRAAKAEEAAGILMTDEEIGQELDKGQKDKEQADSHNQNVSANTARMKNAQGIVVAAVEKVNSGDLDPQLPVQVADGVAEVNKAKQGIIEGVRERDAKEQESQKAYESAMSQAMGKATQKVNQRTQAMIAEMAEMAPQIYASAQDAEDARLQAKIDELEQEIQTEYEKGDDADQEKLNDLLTRRGVLAAYLDDVQEERKAKGESEAQGIRSQTEAALEQKALERERYSSAELKAVLETRETRQNLETEQTALSPVFDMLRSRPIYVDESRLANILYETGTKNATEAGRILGVKLTTQRNTPGVTALDGSFYADLKQQAPGYFKESWDAHPEEALVSLMQRRKLLRSDLAESKQAEKEALSAYRKKNAESYKAVEKAAQDIPPGYALSQFENQNIQNSDVSTEETNQILSGTTHKIDHDADLEKAAVRRIAKTGLKNTVSQLLSVERMSNEDIATGKECLRMLKKNGELAAHAMLAAKLGEEGSRTGKELRVFAQFRKSSAETAAQDVLEMADAYNKKKGRFKKQGNLDDTELSLGDTDYQPFMEARVSRGISDPAMQKLSSDVYKRSGLSVYWADMPDGVRGFFDRDKGFIVLNQKVGATQGAYVAAIHEYTHYMETQSSYSEYADTILKAAYGNEYENSEAMLGDEAVIRDEYAQSGRELTDDMLRKELVAAATEKVLLGDEAFMRQLFAGERGGLAVRMLSGMDTFLRKQKAKSEGKESSMRYQLIEAARAKMQKTIENSGKWKAGNTGNEEQMALVGLKEKDDAQLSLGDGIQIVERTVQGAQTQRGAQQAIFDPDTYDRIDAPMPDGQVEMGPEPETQQRSLFDHDLRARANVSETVRKVEANIASLDQSVSTDNEWGLPLNPFQLEQIEKHKLQGTRLPGLAYNRATKKQRMLCAIISTPQNRRGPNLMTLTEQLDAMEAGNLAVVTEADYNYLLSMAAIVEGSEADEAGIPLDREGEQAYGRMRDAQANIEPVSRSEKMEAWRFINLLSSPVTTLKNLEGNLIMQQADGFSKRFAALIDRAVARKTGTRSVASSAKTERKAGNAAAIERARNAYDDYFVAKTSTSRSRNYDIGGDGRVFEHEALELSRNIINFCMDAGDQVFMEKAVTEEMMALERIKAKVRDEETGELREMTDGERYAEAYKRASERFYHDDNAMTRVMSSVYNAPGVGRVARVVIPFLKTPTNVALRMFDYSPLGLAKSILYDGIYEMNANKAEDGVGVGFDQYKFTMGVARGLTGTGLTIAGALLYSAGILSFGREDEENQKRRDILSALGEPYSMYVNIGGTKHEIAWTLPATAGLSIGAGIAQRMGDGEGAMNIMMGVLSEQFNQIFDNTYLSSVNEIFRGYEDGAGIAERLSGTYVKSYMQQTFSPAALRAIAKTADHYQRDTNSENSLRQLFNETVVQNWPGLRQTLPIKIDMTGDQMTQHKAYQTGGKWENAVMNWVDGMLSPTATYSDKDDAALSELLDLSYRTSDTSFLPNAEFASKNSVYVTKTLAKKLKAGDSGITLNLDDAQTRRVNQLYSDILFNGTNGVKYRTANGFGTYKVKGLRSLMDSKDYALMTDEERVKAIEEMKAQVKELVLIQAYDMTK